MTEAPDGSIEVAPTTTGTAVAMGAILAATAALVAAGVSAALVVGVFAAAAMVVGLRRDSRRAITGGGVLGGVAVIVAGAAGGRTIPTLAATIGVVLAWDAAEVAITSGRQLGSTPATASTERTHLVATGGVLFVGTGIAYGVYRLSRDGLSTAAILALLTGGVLLLWALRQ